ncbi:methyl-accepting chemotaxis protein [Bosea sp. WAO]|uniref:methyl-accepting chemotaxis protein n=1 Tax=Bosea sp. WAO TaxID=406341 RepID=UPI0008324CE1|nr:methyl-accepting chemotaxis protein [Bosea sp. WAO]
MFLNRSLRTIFVGLAGVYALLLVAIGATWYGEQRAAKAVAEAYRQEHASYLLADEFRQSSDELTRLARTFAITGDRRYEAQYLEVAAMRAGEKARPVAPHRIYWDLVLDNSQRPRGPGETKALLTAMKEAGFTAAEFAKLDQAQERSDGLVALETRAMHAVKGLFEGTYGKFTVQGEPDFKFARDLLHSADYHRFKAEIMKPVDEFFQLVEARTRRSIEDSNAQMGRLELVLNALLGTLVLLLIGSAVLIVRRVTQPLAAVKTSIEGLSAGVLETPIPAAKHDDEVGAVSSALLVFRDKLVQIRELERKERAEAEKRVARAEAMSRVVADVGEVVTAAAAGDFSARLQVEDADEQIQKLVAGINEINAVVDTATTEFAAVLHQVAGGDLTQGVETAYRGRFADLKTAINDTVRRLSETVSTIQATSSDVGLAAREIHMGADDLSKRTEEQASSLEETAATTEELAASVKASAEASRQAAATAEEAMRTAESGGLIAEQAVEAMARIETASKKISDITRVIDDIAFQTNLLALNAAVEAARAGDAGRGFAVVASEVRTLAQRSGEAAKDISELISSSNAQVSDGVRLVRQAGEALTHILEASQNVAATISEISTASGEQASGIEEMSQAVAHLDGMTQQNAALSEESAASANSLSNRIGQLNELVAAFRTSRDPAPGSWAAPVVGAATPAQGLQRLRELAAAAAAYDEKPAAARATKVPRKIAVGAHSVAGFEEF